jgi:hypothetical protein
LFCIQSGNRGIYGFFTNRLPYLDKVINRKIGEEKNWKGKIFVRGKHALYGRAKGGGVAMVG